MFLSMWISNTAATAMMLPIIETVLVELEAVSNLLYQFSTRSINRLIFSWKFDFQQGLGDMFVRGSNKNEEESAEPYVERRKRE